MSTVAAIIIGDEILSGKVPETNASRLIELLRDAGVPLGRVVFIGDDLDEIASEVRWCSERYDAVITSGGLGPTHDDRTVEGVARAFGVAVVRDEEIAAMIRASWGDRFTEAALRMADLPAGARVIRDADGLLPLIAVRNVYLLPGIPRLFASKLPAVRAQLAAEPRPLVCSLYLRSDESRIAPLLARVDGEYPEVKIGSYPRFGDCADHRVWVVLECAEGALIDAAAQRLLELLPPEEVVRVERSPEGPCPER